MSVKKAQAIVNEVLDRTGISLVAFQVSELEWLKKQLEDFLDQEVDTDDLADPDDLEDDDSDLVDIDEDSLPF